MHRLFNFLSFVRRKVLKWNVTFRDGFVINPHLLFTKSDARLKFWRTGDKLTEHAMDSPRDKIQVYILIKILEHLLRNNIKHSKSIISWFDSN